MLTNKTIWITGASSGLGAAVAKQLAAQKNYVISSARSLNKLQNLEQAYPNNIKALPCDITKISENDDFKHSLCNITDHLDLVIICAGTCEYDDGPELNIDMYRRVYEVNFFGAINSLNVALPLLKMSKQQPHIAIISSLSAIAAFPRAEAYGSSKAALEYFAMSLKVDLKSADIDVSVIRPGFIDTPLTSKNDFEMPFIMQPEAAAMEVIKGLEKGKLFIHFPWKLSWPIRILSAWYFFWVNWIAPKFIKKEML